MGLPARLASLWRGLFARARMDADLDAELRGYLEELVARKVRNGLTPEAARRAALAEMGGLQNLKQAVRGSWLVSGWDALVQDVRQAGRGLRRTPAASAVAVATFAVGIGAVTAIVGVIKATLFTPPPYADPERLVFVWSDMTAAGYPRAPLSGPELHDLRQRTSSFAGVAAVWASSATLDDGEPEFVRLGLVTSDFFALLGVGAAHGRVLAPADEVEGPPNAILLSWDLWQRRFGGDAGVVGRAIVVNENPATVVGVLPRDFRLVLPKDAGLPGGLEAYQAFGPRMPFGPRGQKFLRVVGRLRPGVGLGAARQDVSAVASALSREFVHYGARGCAFETVGLAAESTREVRAPLWIVAAGVAVLLVISAVNVLAVLVARAAARRREIAVRIALGAGLHRLLRLSLAEGLTLAATGAALGVALGRALLSALLAVRPEALRRVGEVSIDARVVALSAGLALLWGALFALAPLREYTRADLQGLLGSARADGQRLRVQGRSALVVAQVALTVVLLVAAGLLTRTFANIL
ncbi:MAG TPA: ABC transporter permease, partial [Vicinamibacteria bacterium]|nr:ABC transporter permease [Vicinamibacteria bacterium]